ncbi:hypothetical protein A3K82_00175 [Candidatus Pacearchaeota archaeon RBG_19FT_COMBO_34_9]|nr:MAG: hypothetical protein A3K82_00175 [Candidatus Pacearchaeota archaeon RBG_19FT_COMBO_34_9]OGJ17330.1 MAG: hypothetical protein A3K74_01735 [Candidatus Pacearchaeota archaeon RBG_13_33_26]
MEKKKINQCQAKILEEIVNHGFEFLSYHNPQKQLGDIKETKKEIIKGMISLEHDFNVMSYAPKIKGYKVDLYRAEEAYFHYLNQRAEELTPAR